MSSYYVVTTSAHRNAWRGDSLDDRFCTRGVAERRFLASQAAGHAIVRLVRWASGTPQQLALYRAPLSHPRS
jgi:hypothetical protein